MTSPKAIILGASSDRSKYGNKSVRAHQKAGYEVFPVNPKADVIEGLTAYPALSDLPEQTYERLSIYVPAAVSLALLDEIRALDVREVWLNPGADSPELVSRAQALNLPVIQGCSIIDLGMSPSQFPD